MYPLSADRPGPRAVDVEALAHNAVFPPGVTAALIAADPDASRPQWVNPATFWDDLGRMLAANPAVGPADAAMADQARTLLARRAADPAAAALLDRAALAADADLHAAATYTQVGVDGGNGWQRQEGAGAWGTDWFGRAQAAVIYIYVNDYREALYFVRGTDAAGALLDSRHHYTLTFPAGALPPVDRARGGFWSLTMYDKDYFMLPAPPNGRTNLGTVHLDADELTFGPDGALTLHLGALEPTEPAARANWLPAPTGTSPCSSAPTRRPRRSSTGATPCRTCSGSERGRPALSIIRQPGAECRVRRPRGRGPAASGDPGAIRRCSGAEGAPRRPAGAVAGALPLAPAPEAGGRGAEGGAPAALRAAYEERPAVSSRVPWERRALGAEPTVRDRRRGRALPSRPPGPPEARRRSAAGPGGSRGRAGARGGTGRGGRRGVQSKRYRLSSKVKTARPASGRRHRGPRGTPEVGQGSRRPGRTSSPSRACPSPRRRVATPGR